MKKAYVKPTIDHVMVETESFIAATLTGTRATSMQAESAWVITGGNLQEIMNANAGQTFIHGQNAEGTGNRGKDNPWANWDD